MAFADKYVKEFITLEVALLHARIRLDMQTDDEALHDLRIATRRIRSLLIPIRKVEGMSALREAAAKVGRLTTAARDLEVMAGELEKRGFPELAKTRRSRLKADHQRIVGDYTLACLFTELDKWPSTFRATSPGNKPKSLKALISKSLRKQIDKLHAALDDKHFDRHQVRILVKRTRYLTEAFPTLSPLSAKARKSLKAAQSALGSWHDHFQWSLKVRLEPDLQPLEPIWSEASIRELARAELELTKLKDLLPAVTRSKKSRAAIANQAKD